MPALALAAPGGILCGISLAWVYIIASRPLAGTLGATLSQFVSTFAVWVLAERLGLSAVLAIVAFAMTVARVMPERTRARDRVHSYAVWEAAVFVLNVLAFLLIGLQARAIVTRLPGSELRHALGFAALVVLVVVTVRTAWVMLFGAAPPIRKTARRSASTHGRAGLGGGAVRHAWVGHVGRGAGAPRSVSVARSGGAQRIQRGARNPDRSRPQPGALDQMPWFRARCVVFLGSSPAPASRYSAARSRSSRGARTSLPAPCERFTATSCARRNALRPPREVSGSDQLRRQVVAAERRVLARMRRDGRIGDDVFHKLEMELD